MVRSSASVSRQALDPRAKRAALPERADAADKTCVVELKHVNAVERHRAFIGHAIYGPHHRCLMIDHEDLTRDLDRPVPRPSPDPRTRRSRGAPGVPERRPDPLGWRRSRTFGATPLGRERPKRPHMRGSSSPASSDRSLQRPVIPFRSWRITGRDGMRRATEAPFLPNKSSSAGHNCGTSGRTVSFITSVLGKVALVAISVRGILFRHRTDGAQWGSPCLLHARESPGAMHPIPLPPCVAPLRLLRTPQSGCRCIARYTRRDVDAGTRGELSDIRLILAAEGASERVRGMSCEAATTPAKRIPTRRVLAGAHRASVTPEISPRRLRLGASVAGARQSDQLREVLPRRVAVTGLRRRLRRAV